MKKIIMIENMSCENCKKRVEKVLGNLKEVIEVNVDLLKKIATIELNSDVDDDLLKNTINDLGYEVKEIFEKDK